MRKTAVLDVSGNVPDCLHGRPVRDWGRKDIAQSLAHLDVVSAANAVTVISIANLSGRLVLGILSDKIARIRVITIGQVISLVGMAALLFTIKCSDVLCSDCLRGI